MMAIPIFELKEFRLLKIQKIWFLTMTYACATDDDGLQCWGRPDEDGFPDIPQVTGASKDTQYVGGEFILVD